LTANMESDETVEYCFGFDDVKECDTLIEAYGFKVVISPDCIDLLNGAHIDFVEIENGENHFIFLTPNDPSYKPPTEEESND